MSSVNSKNLTFMILLIVLLAFTFSYVLIFNHGHDVIYTDLNELELED